ncbi:hypothetical protein BH10ACT2_BH10ACT2_22320 [soil metagenome]
MCDNLMSMRTFVHRHVTKACSLAALLALVAACSSGSTSSAATSGSSTTDESSTSTSSPTTLTGSTIVASTTVTAAAGTPTTAAAPEPLVLRSDGLGPFDFGSAPAEVIDAITAQLGAPATNAVLLYPDASELSNGYYRSTVGPYYYALVQPVGRTACWAGDFCAEFGGASEATLTFIGWSYSGPAAMLASSSNLTIGARWSDFPSMVVFPSCYTTGAGSHHDIVLVLDAGAWDWLISDGAGGFVPNLPDPHSTRVTFMEAGDRPFEPDLDC